MNSTDTTLDRKATPAFGSIESLNIQEPLHIQVNENQSLYVVNGGVQDVIQVELIFPAGKLQESQPLLAQAVSSLLFSGSDKETAAQIAEKFDYYGAFFSAKPEEDRSIVGMYSLLKNLEQTLPLLAETIAAASFPEQELKIYQQNQKQRLSVNLEKVDFIARRAFFEKLYGISHPYGYYSTFEAYDALNRNILRTFYQTQYTEQAPTIILSGKVGDKEIELVKRFFARKVSSRNELKAYNTPPDTSQKIRIEKADALQTAILLGKKHINRSHEDFPTFNFLNTILGGYFGSRLMSNIREDKGYTYGIHASAGSALLGGYWFISTEVGKEVASSALSEIYKEIALLKNEPVDSSEIDLVRNYMLGTFLRSMDGPFAIADRLKAVLLHNMDFNYFQKWFEKIKNVNADQVQTLANKYFREEEFTEVLAG